jgi:CheY-like chemotaxis protein
VSTGTHDHRVLLVEDYDDTREAFAAELRRAGCDVRDAWGGEDGLRQLRQGFRPCVALIDVCMPGVDGWARLDRMRNDTDATVATTSVVLVSGDPAQHVRARAAGVCEFLPKPLDGDALIVAVERNCGRRAS